MRPFLAVLLFGLTLLAPVATAKEEAKEVPMQGIWTETPTLKICDEFMGDKEDVYAVARKLRRHGAKLKMDAGECSGTPPDDTIWLVGWAPGYFPPGVVGLTFTDYSIPPTPWTPGVLRSAVVFVDLNMGHGVLEHELLHAFGVGHADWIGSIMYPSVEGGGPSWAGVRL